MELKERNFFQKVWTSIKDFEGYQEFAAESLTKSITYIVIFTLIFAVLVAVPYTYKAYPKAIEENIVANEQMVIPVLGSAMFTYLFLAYILNHFIDALVLGILRISFCKNYKIKIKIQSNI